MTGVEQLWATTRLIAAREIRQRLRGRAFRVATAVVVLGVAAAIIIPTIVGTKSPSPRQVGVVGPLSTAQRAAIATAAHDVGLAARLHSSATRSAAVQELQSGRFDLVIVDGRSVLVDKTIAADDTSGTAILAHAIAGALGTQAAIARARLTPGQLAALRGARPVPITALHPAPTAKPVDQAAATVALIVLFILLSQYLTWTLIGVMEEKSNRVVEVLLATVRPVQLLTGKLAGIAATVFLQAGLIVAVALGCAASVGSDVLHGSSPLVLGSTLLWLFLGYAFLSWVYAAAGSLVERQDQVQSLAVPLIIPIVVGYVTAISAISAKQASGFLDALAYLPPTAPFAMPALVALHEVSWWQFALSGLVSVAGTIAMARLAATIYRRAVLRTGGRVRLREVLGRGRSVAT